MQPVLHCLSQSCSSSKGQAMFWSSPLSEEVYSWVVQEQAHDPFHTYSRIPLISFLHGSSQQGFFSGSQGFLSPFLVCLWISTRLNLTGSCRLQEMTLCLVAVLHLTITCYEHFWIRKKDERCPNLDHKRSYTPIAHTHIATEFYLKSSIISISSKINSKFKALCYLEPGSKQFKHNTRSIYGNKLLQRSDRYKHIKN